MKTNCYNVAGITFRVVTDGIRRRLTLPSQYEPFRLGDGETDKPDFSVYVETGGEHPFSEGMTPVATGINDLGEALLFQNRDGGYTVTLAPFPGAPFRTMRIDPGFTHFRIMSPGSDPFLMATLDSMLRIAFAQAAVAHDAFLLHASAVVASGKACLFMGRSGTGKSTHSRLWLQTFPDAELLNDDNPAVRIQPDGTVRAYGTPWSGKTPCYHDKSAPVAGFVRLRQGSENIYTPLHDIDAFLAILPGVSAISHSRTHYGKVCTTLAEVASRVKVGALQCLPDSEASRICRRGLSI